MLNSEGKKNYHAIGEMFHPSTLHNQYFSSIPRERSGEVSHCSTKKLYRIKSKKYTHDKGAKYKQKIINYRFPKYWGWDVSYQQIGGKIAVVGCRLS